MGIAETAALFTSAALEERELTLADGTAVRWHFAKVPSIEWSQYQFAIAGGDEGTRARASLRLVMLSLREPDGRQALNWEQVQRLDPGVAQQLMRAAGEVCRPKDHPGKA